MHDAQQVSLNFALAAVLLAAAATAQEQPQLVPGPQELAPAQIPQVAPEPVAAAPAPQTAAPSPGEARVRAGIVLLGVLHDTLARIQNTESAEAAVPDIMRIARELQSWGQGFASLPPLDETTQSEYEKKYLPIINRINESIRLQAERVAAAEFYGSENLPAALIRLVNSVQ